MTQDNPYEILADEYEAWFSENHHLFMSEVEAISRLLPEFRKGIEVGVGTGLFAQMLGIKEGSNPAPLCGQKPRPEELWYTTLLLKICHSIMTLMT